MKKFLLSLLVALAFSITSFDVSAQSGWSAGNYYQVKGGTTTSCGSKQYNGYNCYRMCKTLKWEQRQYSGYINYWKWDRYSGRYHWVTQWQSGYYWYCWWSPIYARNC